MDSTHFKRRNTNLRTAEASSSQRLSSNSNDGKHRNKNRFDRERHKSSKHKDRHRTKRKDDKGRYQVKDTITRDCYKDEAYNNRLISNDKKETSRNVYNDNIHENDEVQDLPRPSEFSNKEYEKNSDVGAPQLGQTSSSIIKEVLDSKGVFAMKMERLAEIVRWKKLLNAERERNAKPQPISIPQTRQPLPTTNNPPTKRRKRTRFDDGTIYLPSDSPHSSDDEPLQNIPVVNPINPLQFDDLNEPIMEMSPDLREYPDEIYNSEQENIEEEEEEVEDEEEALPPYYPAIQGCRSVEEFQCLNHIEEGTYGIVFRAVEKCSNEIVALKRLKMEREKEGFPITSLREINTLLKAQHSNIVTVREIVVGNHMDSIFIVMDYVEHDLKSLMELMKHKNQSFTIGEVKCLMKQLLCAVAFLHDNWILHRDLKPSNLLVSHKGILKVGDFGLAREYGSPLKSYTPIVVTLWYRSPELLLCTKQYSTAVDLWSVGCIFGEMLMMRPIFQGKSEIEQITRIFRMFGTPNEHMWPGYKTLPMVKNVKLPDYPVSNIKARFRMLTPQGQALLSKLLTYDPSQRITAEDAVKHFYFNESPFPIEPSDFPKWPAKSELGKQRALAASPKPPSGGGEYKRLACDEIEEGFRIGISESQNRLSMDHGFSLKF